MAKNNFRLTDVRSIRRLLNRVANELYSDTIEADKAKTLTSICNSFLKAVDQESEANPVNIDLHFKSIAEAIRNNDLMEAQNEKQI